MKPSACFNTRPRRLLLLVPLLSLLFFSCKDYDEISFSGTIIDTRECNINYLRPDLGYVIKLDSPDSIGGNYTLNGTVYNNCIVLYEPDRTLYRNDHLTGSFYLDDKYSRASCSIHWSDYSLPEGIFLDITFD